MLGIKIRDIEIKIPRQGLQTTISRPTMSVPVSVSTPKNKIEQEPKPEKKKRKRKYYYSTPEELKQIIDGRDKADWNAHDVLRYWCLRKMDIGYPFCRPDYRDASTAKDLLNTFSVDQVMKLIDTLIDQRQKIVSKDFYFESIRILRPKASKRNSILQTCLNYAGIDKMQRVKKDTEVDLNKYDDKIKKMMEEK